jgi:hypothetical protein
MSTGGKCHSYPCERIFSNRERRDLPRCGVERARCAGKMVAGHEDGGPHPPLSPSHPLPWPSPTRKGSLPLCEEVRGAEGAQLCAATSRARAERGRLPGNVAAGFDDRSRQENAIYGLSVLVGTTMMPIYCRCRKTDPSRRFRMEDPGRERGRCRSSGNGCCRRYSS